MFNTRKPKFDYIDKSSTIHPEARFTRTTKTISFGVRKTVLRTITISQVRGLECVMFFRKDFEKPYKRVMLIKDIEDIIKKYKYNKFRPRR